ELYYKYRTDYKIEDILDGRWDAGVLGKIGAASFDEHLSIVSLLSGRLGELFRECYRHDVYVAKLYEYLIYYRDNQSVMMLDDVRAMAEKDLEEQKRAEVLTKEQEHTLNLVIDALTRFALGLKGEIFSDDDAFESVREMFAREKKNWMLRRDMPPMCW